MSKLPYRFIPIPAILYDNGILDPSKKIYKNRLAFLTWAFSQCYAVSMIRNGISYNAFEFSFSRDSGAKESGLTEDEFRTQKEFFERKGYFEKSSSTIKNRVNTYVWKMEKFTEDKIIEISKIPNQNLAVPREENGVEKEKNPQPNQEIPKEIPNQIPNDLREEIEKKPEKNPQPNPHFLRTKEQIVPCLKETNINKEKSDAPPASDDSLFLSLKEKNLFYSSGENESSDELKILEYLVEARNINGVTSKTLSRWLKKYPYKEIEDTIILMLNPENKKVENPGGWIQSALEKGWARTERIKKQNRDFALQFKEKNRVNYLKINQRYCVDLRQKDKEFYFHVDPRIFETQLRNCL